MNSSANEKKYLIVISGPSGAGKSTLVQGLLKNPMFQLSVSCTTRQKRPGEEEGREYYFLSREAFEAKIQQNLFLEYAQYANHYYGTLNSEVEKITNTAHCLLDIDVQGANLIRENSTLNRPVLYLFVEPPNMEVLIERLNKRQNNPDFDLEKRLEIAKQEMAQKDSFDRIFQNHSSEELIQEVLQFLKEKTHS